MLGLARSLLLPALRYTMLVLLSTAVISLLQPILVRGSFDGVISSTVLSQVPGALWQWGFPIARIAFLVGLSAAFFVLGLAATRVSDNWRFVLVGVFAGGTTGYFLFSGGSTVVLAPVLEYFAVAFYAVAGADALER